MTMQPPPPPPSIRAIARYFVPAIRATLIAGTTPESEMDDAANEIAVQFARAWLETLEALALDGLKPSEFTDAMMPHFGNRTKHETLYNVMDDSYTPQECLLVLRSVRAALPDGQCLPPEATSWLIARGNAILG